MRPNGRKVIGDQNNKSAVAALFKKNLARLNKSYFKGIIDKGTAINYIFFQQLNDEYPSFSIMVKYIYINARELK